MSWQFETDPEFQQQLDWMNEFVRQEIWPLEVLDLSHSDLMRAVAPLQKQVKARGLWAAHLGPELGGQGFGQVKLGLMHEILGTSSLAPFAFGNQAPDSGNSEILAIAGSPGQKRRYLEPLLAGEIYSAFSMTEPDSPGSDPTQLRARARRTGKSWILNGHKWFTSNGSMADFLIVMAVTDPGASPRRRASMFLVPVDTPGVTILRDVSTLGHAAGAPNKYGAHSEILYEDVELPSDALLGDEGAGFQIAQQRLYPGRIHHCMRWLGQARRAFDMLCERATYRLVESGEPLGEKQAVQNWIADSAAEMKAAKLMTLEAAWIMDTRGVRAARREISLIKFFGARVLHDVIDRSIQAHGALGFSTDLPLEAMYRAARAARIYDGADEVHRVNAARQILKRHQPPPLGIPSEYLPARIERSREKFAWLLDAATGDS